MYATEVSWDADDDHETSGIVNNPLREKTPPRVHWHTTSGLADTPSSSFFGTTSTPAPTDVNTPHRSSSGAFSSHCSTMASTDRPRLPEASLAPKVFGGSPQEIDNAERWLRYLNHYLEPLRSIQKLEGR
jgi:hypothetical protein